jgi:hypothetical protein
MDDHPSHATVEARMRELIEDAGVAAPDAVVYEPRAVVLLWHEPEVAVVIDLDDGEAPEVRAGPAAA